MADALSVPVTRVRQMVRDRTLLAKRLDGVLKVPALFVQDGAVLKGLPGLLTVLSDAGYSDDEALDWLFREDPSLPGTPISAMVENRGKEVRRRAQALGF
nr:Rv2175c family DNA-binding protein [Parafrankia irregularis]